MVSSRHETVQNPGAIEQPCHQLPHQSEEALALFEIDDVPCVLDELEP